MRKRCSGDDRGILDANSMMHLVALLQTAKNGDGVFDIGLADENNLEAAFEGGVFLDIFAVFIERRCSDGAQFAASQRGFQHVGGVDGAFGGSGADQGVQFVDEKNDLALRVFDFFQDGFEAVFEFAAILGSSEHRSQIERDHALVLEYFRHIAGDNALRQTFDDGSLAHAGFTDEHRIIFRTAGKNLDHAADLFVASDHWIELAAAGLFGQVAGIAFERLVFGLGILVGDFLRTADGAQRFQNRIVGGSVTGEDLLGRILLEMRDCQQQVFRRNVFVLEVGSLFEGLFEQLVRRVRKRSLRRFAGDFGKLFDLAVEVAKNRLRADADFFQHGWDNAFFIFEQGGEQVDRQKLGVAVLGSEVVGALNCFLCFYCEFIPTDGHGELHLVI